MGEFQTIDDKDILEGKTTDIYFENTKKILKATNKMAVKVTAEFTVSHLPLDWNWAVFCGLEEVIKLMAGKKASLSALPEGTIFPARTRDGVLMPVMMVEGSYFEFCIYETPMLGFICQASGIATRTARIRSIAEDKQLLSFGIRRIHPTIAYMADRAAYIGGCDSVSCIASAEKLGLVPLGTMPHSLTIMSGDPGSGFSAYDKHLPKTVPRIALVDTYQDEIREALIAAETVPDLTGVRLDTPASRRGNFPQIIQELRWELDIRGYRHVKIFVSGGINEGNIKDLSDAGADGYGIGTTIVNAPVLDIAMDIVEMEGRPVAKRGKFGGKKSVYRCPGCMQFQVIHNPGSKPPRCGPCNLEMQNMMQKYLENGVVKKKLPKIVEIRDYVKEQLPHFHVED